MWLWYFISMEKRWDHLHPLCDLVITFTKSNPIGSIDPNVYYNQIYGINHWENHITKQPNNEVLGLCSIFHRVILAIIAHIFIN